LLNRFADSAEAKAGHRGVEAGGRRSGAISIRSVPKGRSRRGASCLITHGLMVCKVRPLLPYEGSRRAAEA